MCVKQGEWTIKKWNVVIEKKYIEPGGVSSGWEEAYFQPKPNEQIPNGPVHPQGVDRS